MNKLTAVSATGSFSVNSSFCLSAVSEGRMMFVLGIDFCTSLVAAVLATGSFSIDSSCLSAGSDGRMILILGMDFWSPLVAAALATGCFSVDSSSCFSAGSDGRMMLILGMDFCASLVAFFCFDVERGPRTFFADSTFGVESRVATSR